MKNGSPWDQSSGTNSIFFLSDKLSIVELENLIEFSTALTFNSSMTLVKPFNLSLLLLNLWNIYQWLIPIKYTVYFSLRVEWREDIFVLITGPHPIFLTLKQKQAHIFAKYWLNSYYATGCCARWNNTLFSLLQFWISQMHWEVQKVRLCAYL